MKKIKKPISVLLAMLMVFSLFTIVPVTAYAEETEQPVLYAIATEDSYGDPNRMLRNVSYYDSDGEMSIMNVRPIKLTFYYGVKPTNIPDGNSVWTQPASQIDSCIFDVPVTNTSTSSYPDWYVGSNAPNTLRRHVAVTSVVFDQSCLNASPRSTVNWFSHMSNLKSADLRYLNTGNVSSMKNMFCDCRLLEAVVALGWDIGKLKYTDNMFASCKNLKYIYCEDDWSQSSTLSSATKMFYSCEKLPNFNSRRVDKTNAKSGGYFSNDPLSRLTKDSEGCYEIGSEDDLIFLGDHVGRYEIFSCEGLTFKLTRDLDFTDMPIIHVKLDTFSGFDGNFHPIGLPYDDNFNGYFGGHFDGQNHSITGLIFKNELNNDYSENKGAGLFNILKGTRSGFDAVVENLTLIEPQFNSIYDFGGGIVGKRATRAVIRNCSVLGGSISHKKNGAGIVSHVTEGSIEGCAVIGTSFVSTDEVANSLIAYYGTDLSVKDCVYYNPDELPVARSNYTDGGGNTQVYRLTADDGISVSGERIAYDGKYYFAQNDAVVLTTAEREGYTCIGYTIDDVFTAGNTVNMPNRDVTVSAKQVSSYDFTQSGDTYTIYTADGWDIFCDMLANSDNGYFTGKTVILGNDISVNRQAGISNHDFTGTFDGNGKTLTFNYNGSEEYIAPFYATGDGTSPYFRNLTINGTINSTGKYAAGLIGHLYGNVTIENCKSEIDITSAGNSGGFVGLCEHTVNFTNCLSSTVIHSEGTCNSGFVGWSRANGYEINFTGCLFNGKLLQKNGQGSENGGFIGWTGSNKTVTINNSICAPAALSSGETMASGKSATFARGWNSTTTASNSYYLTAFGTAQAKAAHSVTAGSNVTLALSGTATEYNVSGITAYENNSGLKYGDTIYAGNGDSVSLTLGHNTPTGYSTAYTASAGTLVNGVLTMPDSNVVISAADTQNDYTITTTSEHGTVIAAVGETQNAASAHYGDTVTLTVTANTGYKLTSLTVKDASNNNVTVTENNNGTYSFDMPASNVTVTADFDVESYFDSATGTLHLKGALLSTSGSGIVLPNGVSKDDVLYIDVDDAGATLPSNSSFMFYEFKNVKTIDLTDADTSSVTSMTNMFGFCYALTSLDLTGFDTSQVTGMSYMFNGCRSLTSVDVSGFDTSKVAGMLNMFYGCQSLNTLDLSSFDTSKVWNMYNMFRNCENLENIYVSNKWTTDSVTSSDNMFTNCTHLTGGNGTTFDSSKIDKTYARIDKDGQPGYLTGTYTLTLPDNMAIVTDASADKKVGDRYIGGAVVTFKAKNGYYARNVEANGTALTAENGIYTLYVTGNMIVSADVDVESYFDSTIGTLTLKGTVLRNSGMRGSIILPYGVNKSDVLHIVVDSYGATLPRGSSYLFYYFSNVQSIDLKRANTSNVTGMTSMFYNCQSLTSLDLSSFNTSSVTDMSYMFAGCTALTTLNLSSFNTSGVENMDNMFCNCYALETLDLSSFDTISVMGMDSMFRNCYALETLDLSSFDTSSVMNMNAMFAMMDNDDNSLTTIYVGKNWSTENTAYGSMFLNCTHLKGGNGTACNDNNNISNTYARIDKDGQPGYLTGLYNLTLPEHMEIVTGSENKVGNRYLSGAEVTFKVKTGYGADNVKANGTVLTATDGIYTLTVTDDTEITATIVEYTPVVINSVDINGIITPTTVYKEIYASTDYTVPASPYLDGYTFSGWKVNNGEILSTPEAVQTAVENLVKAGTEVTVEVVYEKKAGTHTVYVTAGVLENGETEHEYAVSELVRLTASEGSPEQVFSYWTRDGKAVSYNKTYSFYMPDDDVY